MLIARFYKNIFDQEVFAQRAITSEVKIEQKIDNFGVANLEIPIIPGLEEDCKIELYEVGNGEDRLIFSGFIYQTDPIRKRRNIMKIVARDMKAVFQKRKSLKEWKRKNGVSLTEFFEKLLWEFNSNYHEQRKRVGEELQVKIEIKVWDTYADIFNEVCEKLERFRTVKNGEVSFLKKLGQDLPLTLMYDWKASHPGNISEISSVGTATACNIVIVEDRNWKTTINTDHFDGVVSGVWSVSVRNGDLQESAQLKAKKLSKRQRKYQVEIIDNSIQAEVGDTVNLDVRNTNHYFDFQGKVMLQAKTITYRNATKRIAYTIWEETVYPYSIQSWQEEIGKEIRMLKLKNLTT